MNAVELVDLCFGYKNKTILDKLSAQIPKGSFTALLGENGTGKTTLVDLIMGFKKPDFGSIKLLGEDASADPHELRHRIAYLSEKVDLPGDWSVGEFFRFNAPFYRHYSSEIETRLSQLFRVQHASRISGLSAGEIRRVQIVAALSIQPDVVLIDEITAVLDITGRQKLMTLLREQQKNRGMTIVMATNILEDLPIFATHILLMKNGSTNQLQSMTEFLNDQGSDQFSQLVAAKLEAA